ncbi:MAG TPA: hypothetical protein VFO54_07090 [Chryseosolibacter sp.]|nr:hypothetical protein [Chryseosolibacter sp.]
MNLSVRTLRQLTVLAVALFFFSCEDETSILGFRNPNKKFQVSYVDIPLNSGEVVAFDSLVTDLRPLIINQQSVLVDGILVGEYQDADLGKVNARSFLTIYPTVSSAFDATAVYDSVTVEFRLNFYGYGFSGAQESRFAIHELTSDTLTLFNGNRYYTTSPAPQYSVDPIGEAVVAVNYDSLQKQRSLQKTRQDTLFAKGRLSDAFGSKLFDAIKSGATTGEAQRIFKAQMKGLALVPAGDPGVLGLNIIDEFGQLSRVFLHYHTLGDGGVVKDTLTRGFGFEFASFTKIEADRTGTELEGIQPYNGVETAGAFSYVQSGAPLVTKLDLAPFYSFADTVENILINSAELVIDNVQAPPGQKPPTLMLRLMDNTSDKFLNNRVMADRDLLNQSRYYILSVENHFTPSTDGKEAVIIGYNDDEDRYAGYMTLFAQSLFTSKNDADGINENRLNYLALYPMEPPTARSVSRAVFSKENVKLRIYYTRANSITP